MTKNIFEDYYTRQAGHGLPVFMGNRYQRGHGLGNILGGLARMVVPVLKRGGQTLLKEGLRTGADILGDVVAGESVKTSAKRRVKQTGSRLLNEALRRPAPPGQPARKPLKRRRLNATAHSKTYGKRKRITRHDDIFE